MSTFSCHQHYFVTYFNIRHYIQFAGSLFPPNALFDTWQMAATRPRINSIMCYVETPFCRNVGGCVRPLYILEQFWQTTNTLKLYSEVGMHHYDV